MEPNHIAGIAVHLAQTETAALQIRVAELERLVELLQVENTALRTERDALAARLGIDTGQPSQARPTY